MKISLKYFVDGLQPVEKIAEGDWIDLGAAEDAEMKAGDFRYLRLGAVEPAKIISLFWWPVPLRMAASYLSGCWMR